MKNNKISFKDILKKQSKSRLISSFLFILFFCALIVVYNIMLLNSISENIVNRGQSAAEKSADEFDDFLSDCSNSLAIVEYTINDLMVGGASEEEILDFIIQQDASLNNMIDAGTTKLYALIGGRIFDGKQRVIRDPDYVPSERPWYTKAMADKGNLVLVDPYKDIHTGNILMTTARTMADEKNIVMFDVSLEHIQNAVEQQSADNLNLTKFVLDSSKNVVAHSDAGELGKNYSDEEGSIGSVIVKNLKGGNEQTFDFSFENHGYSAYIIPITGGWYSVSLVATSDQYMAIRILFLISVIISVITIVSLLLITIRSGIKDIIASRMNAQLSSAADIYMSLSDIDLIERTIIQIKDIDPEFVKNISDDMSDVQSTFNTLMKGLPESQTKQSAIEFVDLSTLDDRLAETNTISLEYLSYGNKWVRGRFVASVRRPDGKLSHVLWMLEDIDEEKRIRDKLTERTEKLTSQLSSAADIYISLCDLDIRDNSVTAIKNANPAIAKAVNACDHNMQDIFFSIMGGLPESPTKKAAIDFCDLSDIDEKLAGTNTITVEYLSYGNIWVRGRYVVSERDAEGKITHVLWMLENIDAEKRSRDRLSAVAEKLHNQMSSIANIYMSAYDFDLTNDTFSEVRASNRQVTGIIGENRENAQQTLVAVMKQMTDEAALPTVLEFVDLTTLNDRLNGVNTISIEYMSKDKMWRRGRFIESERSSDGKLNHVLWVVEDIDKEKKDREKLIDMSERAVAANEAKSAFLSNMSHEIRTPINAVLGMNEMVLRESNDPSVISYSESIRTAGTTLLGLINDILDFSKIEAGKMEIIPVDYDLATVLSDLVNMIQTRLDAKGLMLITDFDGSMPHLLHGDEVRIKQIITNILTNAVKYTETGSVTFTVTYEKVEEEQDCILLKVAIKDTGIGIKQEDMAKLFSKFERIEEERNRTIEGTGLGMSITQSLLSMMNSKLEVSSVYGEGSTFGFSLKQYVRKWDAMGDYNEAHKSSVASRRKYHEKFTAPDAHILVVDDTVMNLLVFTSLLKSTQVRIDTAESGDDGIALASKNKYDIIFLDHMMPHKDGIETLHEIQAAENNPNRNTPMICLTANAISGAREKYLEAGFNDYLTKPIESARLEEMICEYLPKEKIKASAAVVQPKAAPKAVLPDAIFNFSELDTVAGIMNAGSEEMYLELLRSYSDMMGKYIDEMSDYWLDADLPNTAIKLHSLKGASRTVGAVWIRRYAQKLETAAAEGDADTVNKEMEDFMFRCRTLGAALSAALNGDRK